MMKKPPIFLIIYTLSTEKVGLGAKKASQINYSLFPSQPMSKQNLFYTGLFLLQN